MVKKYLLISLMLVFALMQSGNLLAQRKKGTLEYSGFFDSYYYRGPWSYTLGGGLSLYNGDLCGGLGCNQFSYVLNIGANYKIWPRVAFGGEFNYFTLGATDEIKARNISFTSTNYELIAYGRYYFIDDITRVAQDRRKSFKQVKPYATLGLGALMFSPKSAYNSMPADSILRTENQVYPGITLVIPAGFGVQCVINPQFSVLGEVTARYTLTDYLDDVGAARGNTSSLSDMYAFVNVKLQYSPSMPGKKKKKRVLPMPEGGGGGGGSTSSTTDSTGGSQSKVAPTSTDTTQAPQVETTPQSLPETPQVEAPVEQPKIEEPKPEEPLPAEGTTEKKKSKKKKKK